MRFPLYKPIFSYTTINALTSPFPKLPVFSFLFAHFSNNIHQLSLKSSTICCLCIVWKKTSLFISDQMNAWNLYSSLYCQWSKWWFLQLVIDLAAYFTLQLCEVFKFQGGKKKKGNKADLCLVCFYWNKDSRLLTREPAAYLLCCFQHASEDNIHVKCVTIDTSVFIDTYLWKYIC